MDLGMWHLPVRPGERYFTFILPFLFMIGMFGWVRPL
jgi:hypothetical protein